MFNIRSSRQYLGLWIFTVFIFVVSCKKLDLKREIAVKTSGIQLNQDNSVTADGTILDIGDGSIIDHGHCWALTSKPNPTNNYTALGPLSVVGDFESVLPPLGSGTWYIRAYVSVDTDPGPTYIYGAEMEITVSGYACGTALTDTRDGKSYTTIQIGTQCWMAANLNLGSFINSNGPSDNQIDNSIIEKYCYSDSTATCNDEGALYQWDEAMGYTTILGTQGICPQGWHIPTDSEWKSMEVELGMAASTTDNTDWRGSDEGTQIKVSGSSGFEARTSGFRQSNGLFSADKNDAYYWTSSEMGTQAWARGVKTSSTGIYRNTINKSYGLCIRCLKD